ncbi:PD-(D/E)XK nuclease family protein [Leptolyngbya sp. PCC 6406]|uniref:PD-(D/E)XK nuclease family protein n=1 Tax=Leptolyngbya sp. PCC 6406 TaxID=1173264 RepID=UPI0002ABADFC|nr:DUF3782 domain-containing protein [Leptolyngbya sp. PCC 6406]
MTDEQFKALLKQSLPSLLQQDTEVRDLVLRSVSGYFAGRTETESRFDRVLDELRRDREEQALKWQEQTRKWDEQARERERDREEQARKWQEQNRKWDENQEQLRQMLAEIRDLKQKHDGTVGALGARWGISAENAFRNALKGILEDSFGVEVLNVTEYDDAGEVFGRPDQVELDIIIKNGDLLLCEIKSSFSKADLYAFLRKTEFYEKHHQRRATRKIVISPMVHPLAQPIASRLGIEVYSNSDIVPVETLAPLKPIVSEES